MNQFPVADPGEVSGIAAELGFRLDDGEAATLTEAIEASLEYYRTIDRIASAPVSPSEPVTGLRRPGRSEDRHHAWEWMFDLRPHGSGPLTGLTVAVKASIEVAGVPVSVGNDLVRYVPRRHAPVVERLLEAGAHIVGTTRLTEFENDGSGVTGSRHPLTANPAWAGYLPGGSSSGSAAVVVEGAVDIAIGSDSGGSIREPASWSGCVGFKPTHGLVPPSGAMLFDPVLSDIGPLARTVEGCARALTAIADGSIDYTQYLDTDLTGWRIGVLQDGFNIPGESEPEVDAAVKSRIDALSAAGADIIPVSIPRHRDGVAIWSGIANEGTYGLLFENAIARPDDRPDSSVGYMDEVARTIREMPERYPITRAVLLTLGRYLSSKPHRRRYAIARELAVALRRDYDDAFRNCDLLVMPTTPARARPARAETPSLGTLLSSAAGSFHNAAPFNATGHPALSIPVEQAGELPIGLMIVAPHHEDARALRAGHAALTALAARDQAIHAP